MFKPQEREISESWNLVSIELSSGFLAFWVWQRYYAAKIKLPTFIASCLPRGKTSQNIMVSLMPREWEKRYAKEMQRRVCKLSETWLHLMQNWMQYHLFKFQLISSNKQKLIESQRSVLDAKHFYVIWPFYHSLFPFLETIQPVRHTNIVCSASAKVVKRDCLEYACLRPDETSAILDNDSGAVRAHCCSCFVLISPKWRTF